MEENPPVCYKCGKFNPKLSAGFHVADLCWCSQLEERKLGDRRAHVARTLEELFDIAFSLGSFDLRLKKNTKTKWPMTWSVRFAVTRQWIYAPTLLDVLEKGIANAKEGGDREPLVQPTRVR